MQSVGLTEQVAEDGRCVNTSNTAPKKLLMAENYCKSISALFNDSCLYDHMHDDSRGQAEVGQFYSANI
jgi:hypothetical protein